MKSIVLFLSIVFLHTSFLFASNENDTLSIQKQCFYNAKTELENMLSGKTPLDYEKAIFLIENAYRNNETDYGLFKNIIDFHTNNIKRLAEANRNEKAQDFKQKFLEVITEEQKKERYNKLLYNWAIYTYLTDTTFVIDSNFLYYHLPYEYSNNDPMGTINWENAQVFSLLNQKKANCFALASLFKIFAERLNTDANLGLAPGHIFINHDDANGINYNIELASRSFPGAGSIMTLTYSPTDAVRNGISMRTLDLKQSVALCLVYLGKGYEHKFNTKTDDFILQCAETTLQYDSLNLNAMLMKTEVLERKIIDKNKSIVQLQQNKDFKEYEKQIAELYVKGYREMPLDMKNIIINKLQKDSLGLILTDHTPMGFQFIHPKDDRYATLSWGMFDEIHEAKLIEQYNNTLFNTKTGKIIKFVVADSLYNKYQIDAAVFAWQVDPLTYKYPMMSPYMAFADNPIFYIDNDGREFWIGGDRAQAIADVESLLPVEYRPYLKYSDEGKVTWDIEKLNKDHMEIHLSDAGAKLVTDLVYAKEKYCYQADIKCVYNTSTGPQEKTLTDNNVNPNKALTNLSIQERFPESKNNSYSRYKQVPIGNDGRAYDGMVTIHPNAKFLYTNNTEKLRKFVVFHELKENFERTTNKKYYGDVQYHENGNTKYNGIDADWSGFSNDSAHGASTNAQTDFYDKTDKTPGAAGSVVPASKP